MKLSGGFRAAFLAWVRQPTTIHGIAVLVGVAAAGLVNLANGNMTQAAVVGAVYYAIVHLVINDATASVLDVKAPSDLGAAPPAEFQAVAGVVTGAVDTALAGFHGAAPPSGSKQ